jgi:hypothetical protein
MLNHNKKLEKPSNSGLLRFVLTVRWSRDSTLGIATGYGLDNWGLIPGWVKIFSSPQRPTSSGVHPASCLMVTWGSLLGG